MILWIILRYSEQTGKTQKYFNVIVEFNLKVEHTIWGQNLISKNFIIECIQN